ncbi:transgelin [Nematocida major]|uniref:transgelin n=1 Tax=Nematocida major TaxID=1912982 RepID=UPI0020075C0A|nr:transgelin [Nematocida major]KAH9386911.1 transgelin [Nematocida major]
MNKSSEVELLSWIKSILSLKINEEKDSLMDLLADGIVLCNLINAFIPKKCNPKPSNVVFKRMENIDQFLRAAREIGVLDSELFQTVDLVHEEKKNPKQVAICLYSLSRNLKKTFPKSKFKIIGPKLTDPNIREFTAEQLDMGKKIISVQMGTNKGATQSGHGTGVRQITPGYE